MESESEKISDPARVVPLLERLAKRRTLISVRIDGHRELFNSCIVEVNRQHVLLDELLPNSGHQLMQSQRGLRVIAKLDGIDIRFDTMLDRVDSNEKLVTYYTKLPAQLEYGQRRLDFRVHIPMARRLRVFIDDGDEAEFEGVLHDLSHGGAGMIFPQGKPEIMPGSTHDCAIEMTENDWLYTTVELRYAKSVSFRNKQMIGVRFTDLSPQQAHSIRQYLSELQRELLRRRTAV